VIDASIPLQIKQPQIEDPTNALLRILQLKGLQSEQEMNGLKTDEYRSGVARKNKLQQLLDQDYAKPEERESALLRGGFIDEADKLGKSRTETAKGQAAATKDTAEVEHKTIGLYRDASQSIGDYASAVEFVKHMHTDPRLANSAIARVPLDQAIAQIPQDPSQIGAWKQQFALGATKFMELNKPTISTRNLGGTTDTIATEGLTGQTRTVNSAQNTQSPDNAATNARMAQEGAANRGQSERHFQAGQNAPQYMETDAGLVALPKKLGAGQAPIGTPVMGADGQPLGKPLKQIPPSVNTAIIQNSQSLNQIDRALTLLGGKNVGDPAKGGQQGDPAATGVKGYLPQGILNRIDPSGVDTRAEISDIGSLKIHDRSGAAVTLSESPRLMPFIPLATDDAVTVKKKLARLKTELTNESQALQQTYSKDQGYKPSPVKPAGATGGWSIQRVN
jgi:hypothetical protein